MKTEVSLLRRTMAFSAVGAMGMLVQVAVLWLLAGPARLHYLPATLCATEAAILHNFAWHLRWTWRDRVGGVTDVLRRLGRFHAANGFVSLGANLVLMSLLVGVFGLHYLAANVLAVAVAAVANLLLCDRWVFRRAVAAAVIAVALLGTPPAGPAGHGRSARSGPPGRRGCLSHGQDNGGDRGAPSCTLRSAALRPVLQQEADLHPSAARLRLVVRSGETGAIGPLPALTAK